MKSSPLTYLSECAIFIASCTAIMWICVVSAQTVEGLVAPEKVCNSPTKRIELIFPGVLLGCYLQNPNSWLNSPLENKK